MKSILVIEDDRVTQTLLEAVLREAGYDTRVAQDGEEGVQLYRQRPADLVITDIFMPDGNGFDVIKKLQGIQPGVKIIAMSGDFSSETSQNSAMAEVLGILKTLPKPFNRNQLLEYIAGVLHE